MEEKPNFATTSDMDMFFSAANSTLNSIHGLANACIDLSESRRNAAPGQPNSYRQPISYGYGYADNGSNPYNMFGNVQNNTGYPGFSNPAYGNPGGLGGY